jgi:hypothetical protein
VIGGSPSGGYEELYSTVCNAVSTDITTLNRDATNELSEDLCKAMFDTLSVNAIERKLVKLIPILVRFNLMESVTTNVLDVFQSETVENLAEDIRRPI